MSYKTFDLAQDVAQIASAINEVVAISASLYAQDSNIKYFKNIVSASAGTDLGGYWQSAYDAAPSSPTSTALIDFTYGYHTSSLYNTPATVSSSQNEKIKVYREMANILLGDPNAQFTIDGASQSECFFLMIKRSIQKDEIKKGATRLIFSTSNGQVTGTDPNAPTSFKQGPGGDYSPLKYSGTGSELAQVWYQAGIIVVPDSTYPSAQAWSGTVNLNQAQYSSSINQLVDGFRKKLDRVDFHNQTNLFSTVYFCRLHNSDFNYSSNPTFVDNNQRIRVTSGSNVLQTRTYVTTVGFYDANDNLLAVGKVNKPITKGPDNEIILRARLDF